MGVLNGLKPTLVWEIFEEICAVPRPSKKEGKIIAWLLDFAKKHNLSAKQDKTGNVLISKPASAGRENAPIIALQSHMDMVCEKNNDVEHNFDVDPIVPYIDGEWVKAKGTTLGADDGIGMAAALAVLVSDDIKHGAIECLFTVDEETGLTGAFALEEGFFTARTLLNLDSEDEGQIFIGCAGGIDSVMTLPYKTASVASDKFAVKIIVKGLLGGHSGDDINKNRANAIKVLNRFLWEMNNKYGITVADVNGGNLRNAIAREAYAVIVIDSKYKESVRVDFNIYAAEMEFVWKISEPKIMLELDSIDLPTHALDAESTTILLNSLYACPHGVFETSTRMIGTVATSTNLASVKLIDEQNVLITTSQRSELESEKMNIANMIKAVFAFTDADVKNSDGYPGWSPNPDSKILKIAQDSYSSLFGKEPKIKTIHAGLECGLFLKKYPGLDMISFGPTLRGVHSPDEMIKIDTVDMWWKHLVDILERF